MRSAALMFHLRYSRSDMNSLQSNYVMLHLISVAGAGIAGAG